MHVEFPRKSPRDRRHLPIARRFGRLPSAPATVTLLALTMACVMILAPSCGTTPSPEVVLPAGTSAPLSPLATLTVAQSPTRRTPAANPAHSSSTSGAPQLGFPPGQYVTFFEQDTWPNLAYFAVSTRTGQVYPIVRDVTWAALSPSSEKLIYVREGNLYLEELRDDDKLSHLGPFSLPKGTSDCGPIAWSPDSMRALLHCGRQSDPPANLLLEGGELRVLQWAEECSQFSWSPDATRFAASCGEPGMAETHIDVFDHTDALPTIVPGCKPGVLCRNPEWSILGDSIVFLRGYGRSGERQPDEGNYAFDPQCEGSTSKCVHPLPEPAFSPEWLAWSPISPAVAFRDDVTIKIQNLETRKVVSSRQFLDLPQSILWCPDGESLAFSIANRLMIIDSLLAQPEILYEGHLPSPAACVIRYR